MRACVCVYAASTSGDFFLQLLIETTRNNKHKKNAANETLYFLLFVLPNDVTMNAFATGRTL